MSARAGDGDKLDFPPYDCTETGERYRQFRRSLLSTAAGKTDRSGSSVADNLLDTDMGGGAAGAPPLPQGRAGGRTRAAGDADSAVEVSETADLREMQRLRTARSKAGFALIWKHISDETTRAIIAEAPYFQDGRATLEYLNECYDRPLKSTDLEKMKAE